MREILFRGLSIMGEWHDGNLSVLKKKINGVDAGSYISNRAGMPFAYMVRPETVGQFTGLADNNGVKIFEGDLIQIRRPVRLTQTHTGDNIPNGSYTEPMEAGIEIRVEEVIFRNGCFCLDNTHNSELCWDLINIDIDEVRSLIDYKDRGLFESNDDLNEDIQYIMDEYNLKNEDELCELVSGVIKIGNIHESK